jgi:biotin carboxyl carrier protein
MRCEVEVNGRIREVVIARADGHFVVTMGDRAWMVDARRVDSRTLSLLVREKERDAVASHEIALVPDRVAGQLAAHVGPILVPVAVNGWRQKRGKEDRASATGAIRLVAPMPGKVVRVLAAAGTAVTSRQPIVVVEAMKMENELRAGRDGVVTQIAVSAGQSVEAGALLAVVAPGKAS